MSSAHGLDVPAGNCRAHGIIFLIFSNTKKIIASAFVFKNSCRINLVLQKPAMFQKERPLVVPLCDMISIRARNTPRLTPDKQKRSPYSARFKKVLNLWLFLQSDNFISPCYSNSMAGSGGNHTAGQVKFRSCQNASMGLERALQGAQIRRIFQNGRQIRR